MADTKATAFDIEYFAFKKKQLTDIRPVPLKTRWLTPAGLFRFNPNTDQESQMYRVSRAEGHHLMKLDLMFVAPVFEPVWNDRETGSLGEIEIKIVSKRGLITMKSVAGRPQDIADIDALRRLEGE